MVHSIVRRNKLWPGVYCYSYDKGSGSIRQYSRYAALVVVPLLVGRSRSIMPHSSTKKTLFQRVASVRVISTSAHSGKLHQSGSSSSSSSSSSPSSPRDGIRNDPKSPLRLGKRTISSTIDMAKTQVQTASTLVGPSLDKLVSTVRRLVYPPRQQQQQHQVINKTRSQQLLPPPTTTTKREKLTLAERVPRGSWDSHMHVVDPDTYELSPKALYRPSPFTVKQAMDFENSVGINNIVLVQPSIYGTDNSCLLDTLRILGPNRARGVVAINLDTVSPSELKAWHHLGVRGVRLNIQSVGRQVTQEQLEATLRLYADAVRPLNWVVQVYVPLHLVELLEPIIPKLNVRFCIDHLGHPCLQDPDPDSDSTTPRNPYDLPGFASLARLLESGQTFVKLSAPYRISKREDLNDVEPIAKEIMRLGGTRNVVFATDWPHTRFEGLDIRPWIEKVLDWCGNDDFLRQRLFRRNAEALWDVTRS